CVQISCASMSRCSPHARGSATTIAEKTTFDAMRREADLIGDYLGIADHWESDGRLWGLPVKNQLVAADRNGAFVAAAGPEGERAGRIAHPICRGASEVQRM